MFKNIVLVYRTKNFVKRAFQMNPHYSFNHWSIMYNHSVRVMRMALRISKKIKCNKLVLAIATLLHDIGKTHNIDTQILHKDHEDFNLLVSEVFLNNLGLSDEDLEKIKNIIQYNSDSIEMKILKDADALSLYYDKKLYMFFIAWALENNFNSSIERKINKYNKLNFEISRNLGKKKLNKMKADWDDYKGKIKIK